MSGTSSIFNNRLIAFNAKQAEKKFWTGKLQSRKELFFPAIAEEVETRQFTLDAELHARLRKICPEPQALFVLLTAALGVQLYKVLDENTITIGTAAESEINEALPVIFDVTGDASFREVVNAVKQAYLEAKANQDYPIDLLLKDEKLFNIGINTDAPFAFNFHLPDCTVTGTDVERVFNNYQFILQNCLQAPDKKIKEINAVEENLEQFNATTVPYPADKTIIEVFEEQVRLRPNSIALIYEDQQLTYAELNDKANALSEELNVPPGTNVPVCRNVDIEYIVSILAILKAGCAYVPISPQDPRARIEWLLEEIKTPSEKPIAYIMFTSGSTGNPKGVMVTHQNVLRLVCNANYVNLSLNTRILLTGAPGFDATTFEIWGSLLNGGVLVLADREKLLDTELFHHELTRHNINTLWLTSPFFNQLVQQSKCNIFSGLSYLLVGGDVLSPKHINAVRKDNPGLKIINGYGPTENTTFSLTHAIEQDYERSVPIGRPINNSTAYVLDRDLNIKPIGAWGILYVGGDGVSAGYLNSPELTEKKFISWNGERLYSTDDVARLLPDLTVEFKGRIDDQVKIRGFRITLGEIEYQLNKLVDECVVVVNEENGDKQLAAYYVSASPIADLKTSLFAALPDYMVPAYFVHLASMPLTLNGKVNKKLLPAVQQSTVAYEAPADETEAQLVGIWTQLFQMENISVTANFFDLGGHSLKATALMNSINRSFDTRITIKDIFSAPTIREQGSFIKMNQWASANKEYDNVEGIEIVV